MQTGSFNLGNPLGLIYGQLWRIKAHVFFFFFFKESCYHLLGAITLFLVGGLPVTFIKEFCHCFEATLASSGVIGVYQV